MGQGKGNAQGGEREIKEPNDRIAAFEKWQKENYPKAYYKPGGLKW